MGPCPAPLGLRSSSPVRIVSVRPHRYRFSVWLVVVALVLAVAPTRGAGVAAADEEAGRESGRYYAQETGHTLAEPFLDHWADDAAAALGLPVTEAIEHGGGRTQYFANGVLSAPDGDGLDVEPVVAIETGAELLAARHDPTALVAGRGAGGDRSAAAFAPVDDGTATEPSASSLAAALPPVPDEALDALDEGYEAADGDDWLGEPISRAHVRGGRAVRWYSHGRVEVALESDAEARVAPVGWELARARGVDMDPIDRGELPLFDLTGFDIADADADAQVADTADATGGEFADASGAFTPVRLVIPDIGVDAGIEQVGIVDGVMGTPVEPMNVGWYSGLSSPGTGSNVVMAGHVDYYTVGPAVFYGLGSLGYGATISVLGPDGAGITYAVSESYVLGAGAGADGVIAPTGVETLTLITCTGAFAGGEYDSRQIVRATRI